MRLQTRGRYVFAVALVGALACTGSADAGVSNPIDSIPPGHWYRVANSRLSTLDPCSRRNCSYSAVQGQISVMATWSGGAYDTRRDRLIVWGGGHSAYAGNEVYAFDINTLRWSRLTNPSTDVGGSESSGYYPDGLPRSRHTYNYVEYLPSIDRFCSFGGAGLYPSGQIDVSTVDCFNFDTLSWERKASAPAAGTTRIGSKAVYDPVGNRVYLQTGLSGTLSSYNPATNSWQTHNASSYMDYDLRAAIDPARRKMVAVGRGQQYILDLDNPAAGFRRLTTTGDNSIIRSPSPGLVYDSSSDRVVAWSGGAAVYTLNLDTRAWARMAPSPTNTVTPPQATDTGINGRFQYVPSKNVFVLVSGVEQDVYIFRLTQALEKK